MAQEQRDKRKFIEDYVLAVARSDTFRTPLKDQVWYASKAWDQIEKIVPYER